MKLICQECGGQYESGKFCPECGIRLTEIEPVLVCPSCGLKAKSGKFCQECGTRLVEESYASSNGERKETGECKLNEKVGAADVNCGNKEIHNSDPKEEIKADNRIATYKGTIRNTGLPMDAIKNAISIPYANPSLKKLALAAYKIAEVIQERLPHVKVSYMVHPSEFDSKVSNKALPIHFLFMKNGIPKLALVTVTAHGYNCRNVLETAKACWENGIEYVRVFADGSFADWLEPDADAETVRYCNDWLVRQIIKNLL